MTGLSARTLIPARRPGEETPESSITLEPHVLIFAREAVKKAIPASSLTAFSSAGFTRRVTAHSLARTVPVVKEGFVFSLTRRSSFGSCPSRVREEMSPVQGIWITLAHHPFAIVSTWFLHQLPFWLHLQYLHLLIHPLCLRVAHLTR